MKAFFFCTLLYSSVLFSNSTLDMALKESSDKYNIEKALLLAIVLIESNSNKNAIGAMPKTSHQKEKLEKYLNIIKVKYYSREKKRYFSIYPSCLEQAKKVLLILDFFNINYDLGLTQINTYNIKKRKLDRNKLLNDTRYSIDIGAKILRECITLNNSRVNDSIECYNKGTNKKKYSYSYSKKIMKKYKELKNDFKE